VAIKTPHRAGRTAFRIVAAILATVVTGGVLLAAQAKREFDVTARRYTFVVGESNASDIRVAEGDIVRVAFAAEDIAHSFTVDDYRINKRAEPGKPVTFDFRADRAGTFEIYCSLSIDSRCRKETVGRRIVAPKSPR
jgi:heme/copper-type cytochrome/quinol oxidase subunit 2